MTKFISLDNLSRFKDKCDDNYISKQSIDHTITPSPSDNLVTSSAVKTYVDEHDVLLQTQFDNLVDDYHQTRRYVYGDITDRLRTVETDLKNVKETITNLDDNGGTVDTTEIIYRIVTVESDISTIKTDLDTLEETVGNLGVDVIKTRLNTIETNLSKVETNLSGLTETVNNLGIDDVKSRLTTVETDLGTAKQNIAQNTTKITEIETSVNNLSNSVSNLQEVVQDINLDTINIRLTTAETDIDTTEQHVADNTRRITVVENAVELNTSQINKLQESTVTQSDIDNVNSRINGVNSNVDVLSAVSTSQSSRIDQLRTDLTALEETVNNLDTSGGASVEEDNNLLKVLPVIIAGDTNADGIMTSLVDENNTPYNLNFVPGKMYRISFEMEGINYEFTKSCMSSELLGIPGMNFLEGTYTVSNGDVVYFMIADSFVEGQTGAMITFRNQDTHYNSDNNTYDTYTPGVTIYSIKEVPMSVSDCYVKKYLNKLTFTGDSVLTSNEFFGFYPIHIMVEGEIDGIHAGFDCVLYPYIGSECKVTYTILVNDTAKFGTAYIDENGKVVVNAPTGSIFTNVRAKYIEYGDYQNIQELMKEIGGSNE